MFIDLPEFSVIELTLHSLESAFATSQAIECPDSYAAGLPATPQMVAYLSSQSNVAFSDVCLYLYVCACIAVEQLLVSGLHWSSSARQSLAARQKELSE